MVHATIVRLPLGMGNLIINLAHSELSSDISPSKPSLTRRKNNSTQLTKKLLLDVRLPHSPSPSPDISMEILPPGIGPALRNIKVQNFRVVVTGHTPS